MSIERILVADDEESMRWVLSKALKRKGFSVDLAIDGRQALGMIQDNNYDLAILDIKMPGINGLDLLERIREMKSDLLVVITAPLEPLYQVRPGRGRTPAVDAMLMKLPPLLARSAGTAWIVAR